MKTNSNSKQKAAIKIAFICLGLLLSGCLFASGLIALEVCGINSHMGVQFSGEGQMRCFLDCSSRNASKQCASHCSLSIELPNVALVADSGVHSDSLSLTVVSGKTDDVQVDPKSNPFFLSFEKAIVSPPIFLQNQSFLI